MESAAEHQYLVHLAPSSQWRQLWCRGIQILKSHPKQPGWHSHRSVIVPTAAMSVEDSCSSCGGSGILKWVVMAIRPLGWSRRPYRCHCSRGWECWQCMGPLGRWIGNWAGTTWGKGWTLPHGLSIMFCWGTSLETSVASHLSTGELRT